MSNQHPPVTDGNTNSISLKLHRWRDQESELLTKGRELLLVHPSESARELAMEWPESDHEQRPLSIALVGPYSAGKSTLIRALTGRRDIETGPKIVTARPERYAWNGLELIDTPGIGTELHPEHDTLTDQAIREADLVLFVVTSQLFDKAIADRFLKVAVEDDRAQEMMLVVNKMSMQAEGNSTSSREAIKEDLNRVLHPSGTEDFHVCFLDAAKIERELDKEPENRKPERLNAWGFQEFVSQLDAFVKRRGALAAGTTRLYAAEQVLQRADAALPEDDENSSVLREMLLRRRAELVAGRGELTKDARMRIREASARIREMGRNTAEMICDDASQDDITSMLHTIESQANDVVVALNDDLVDSFRFGLERIQQRSIRSIAEDAVLTGRIPRFLPDIRNQLLAMGLSEEELVKLSSTGSQLRQAAVRLIENSRHASPEGVNLLMRFSWYNNYKTFSGTPVHKGIKAIGKRFGYKFKPFQAIKLTRYANNAGLALGLVGSVLAAIGQIREERAQDQRSKQLRNARHLTRQGIGQAADEIEMHFDKLSSTFVAESISEELEDIDTQLDQLSRNATAHRDYRTQVSLLRGEITQLIRTIHEEGAPDMA